MKKILLFLISIFMFNFVSACIIPSDGMIITEDTTFCSGDYYLPNGVNIGLFPTIEVNNITLNCNGAKIRGNYHNTGQWTSGVSFNAVSDITVKNCKIDNYAQALKVGWYGINLTIENNQLLSEHGNTALTLESAVNSIIKNNSMFGTVYLKGTSRNNLFLDNVFNKGESQFGSAFFIHGKSYNNHIKGNSFLNTYNGLNIQPETQDNLIENNSFKGTLIGFGTAIVIHSQNNTIINNNIESYSRGILVTDVSATGNLIYNNNLFDCSNYAVDNDENAWDTLENGGNYWDIFDEPSEGCFDEDSNGVCDAPFIIDENSQDNLAFTNPNGWKDYVYVPDEDDDGVLNDEDKCSGTITGQVIYGCSCEQILELKPGEDTATNREGCSKGIINVFTKAIGWAKDIF